MIDIVLKTMLVLPILYYSLIFVLTYLSPHPAPPTKKSLTYLSASEPKKPGGRLTPIVDKAKLPSIELSVVIPAYNEEHRLRDGLMDALKWLEEWRKNRKEGTEAWQAGSYEVIIVDDGSKDRTVEVALDLAIEHAKNSDQPALGEIRVVQLGKNRGKGGAVRHGILYARGHRILFADADGASDFSDLQLLMDRMDEIAVKKTDSSIIEEFGMAIGSRAHLVSSETVVSRSKFRNFLMKCFHLYLYILGLRDIRDTQCGFKLLTRATARQVVDGLHVEGWIFDVELLLLAKLMDPPVPIAEVPIRWNEVSGSKLSVIKDSITMAIELLIIRLNYMLGVWKVPKDTSRSTT
ncbi:hypothetical protein CROQUDRAFT_50156 [Cronartium quercuum f. sp. fusiforme G11]|uniref:dolichyl-phosphate beta-glucosyltransferase n=1 Tax=Cronartium quercuum f. sp. fusiforme G11 TaxID=708437 RepID=A0A9P6T9H2_9BASI|nr:hypothetical protein CROQUDRAFT_50156 [Cronartium quercuum f. sp. fusiforme G11]